MDPVMSDLDQKIGGCFSESMSSVFSMLTGREFAIKPQDGNTLDHVGVSALHSATVVYVKAHYTKGMTGTLLFALPLKEGTMLVDLMLGGDGTPSTELAGDSRDALAETFNQIMGSANQALSDLAGETLSISNVEIFSAEGGDSSGLEEIMGPGPFYDLPLETSQENLGTLIHVLINENCTSITATCAPNSGALYDHPFDITTNTFRPARLISTGNSVAPGFYLGSGGVSGLFDTNGVLHIAYWAGSNHIDYAAFT
ncbi:MAG: hypothetical protein HGA66_17840, partial [Holophaga sp.]|nr:hypothetical protein [Holophaga sp.]